MYYYIMIKLLKSIFVDVVVIIIYYYYYSKENKNKNKYLKQTSADHDFQSYKTNALWDTKKYNMSSRRHTDDCVMIYCMSVLEGRGIFLLSILFSDVLKGIAFQYLKRINKKIPILHSNAFDSVLNDGVLWAWEMRSLLRDFH